MDTADDPVRKMLAFLAGSEGASVAPLAEDAPVEAGAATRKVVKGYWEKFCDRVQRSEVEAVCIVDFAYRDARPGGLNLPPDKQLLERAYCFIDRRDDAAGRRVVVLHAHTMRKWAQAKNEHPSQRVDKITAVNVRHANLTEDGRLYAQEHGSESFGVVPVSGDLRDGWRDALAAPGRTAAVEWCWRTPSSMPTREVRSYAATEAYRRLGMVIALGQSLLDKHPVNDAWAQSTGGPSEFNKLISGAPLLPRGPGSSSEAQREGEIVALVRKKVMGGAAGAGGAAGGPGVG